MKDDGGSRGGSRLNFASGGRDYYPSIDELVNAKDGEFKALTGKLTKDWLLCLLKDALSHLRTAKSFISKFDMLKEKVSSVNDAVIENKKFKEQILMKLDELTAIKETVSLSYDYACAIKICLGDVVIFIICIFNPRKGSPFRVKRNIITEQFCCFLKDNPNAMIIITGDLNQPAVEWNSFSTNDPEFESFLDLMVTHSLIQLINSSTRKSGSILDVLISNLHELSLPPKHINPVCFSDHYAISAVYHYIEFPSSTVDKFFSPPVYRIPFHSFADIGSALVSSPFSVSIRTSGEDYVSSWFQQFESIVYQLIERKRKKRVEIPWFYTSHTVHLHNKLKTASNFNSPETCKNIKENFSMSIELDTVTFLDIFAEKKDGTTACYSLLSKLGNQSIPLEMVYNDTKISGYENIANKFNGFFISMYGASTATDLNFSEREFNSVSFDLHNVNEDLMNASLGTGIDLIPGLLLRHTSSSLSFHVLKLFEAIVESSVYPLSWKRAVITPSYKSGNKCLIVSYRPISVLPKLSLVFEKFLFKFLYPLIKNQLSNYQFGFRKG